MICPVCRGTMRWYNERFVCPVCGFDDTPELKSQTKADRIRSMTDEELAEFIERDPLNDICPNNCENDRDRPCRVCALDWLKQKAEEGER